MSPDAAGGPHRRPRTGPETYPHYPTYPQADSACSDSKDHETFNSWQERPPGNGRKIQPPAGKKRPLSDEAHDLPAGRPEEARAKPKPGGASLPTQAERGSEGNPAAPQSSEQGTANGSSTKATSIKSRAPRETTLPPRAPVIEQGTVGAGGDTSPHYLLGHPPPRESPSPRHSPGQAATLRGATASLSFRSRSRLAGG